MPDTVNYIIENRYIRKTLSFASKKLCRFSLENRYINSKITAKEDCEIFTLHLKTGLFSKTIKSSNLKLKDYSEDKEKGEYIFTFKKFSLKDSKILVKLIYNLGKDDEFLRKRLELSYDKKGEKKALLDYIDFETITNVPEPYWSIKPGKGYAPMKEKFFEMGQPVYTGGFYFGLEFPISYSKIQNGITTIRYYSGKDISDLIGETAYKTHSSIIGVAKGNSFKETQKAFFKYIASISKPLKLRRQYNSWFDNMLNITRENLYDSFLNVEKAMTRVGEKPLDCYVADDGWNNYANDFWSFNEKFPDELYPFSSLTECFGSRFGLWLGPRGGYTGDTIKFARNIEKAGNGFVNKRGFDICVASDKYAKKTGDLLLNYQKRFKLNYWKLDGFACVPCKNKKHDHMVGGFNDMYFYTDVWEKWTKIFERLSEGLKEFYWINLTCYAPPSAWFLKYVNSLWMQVSLDVGFTGKKGEASDKDRMLSYRDEAYFNFYEDRQFQFPPYRLYNHDPIYGNEAKVSMTDGEFREYLFTMAARGTSFWELYYSYSMMNEAKWRINYSVLRFIEDNLELLALSVIFGKRASQNGVYGYASFSCDEGLVTIRNSTDKPCDYFLKIDENIGAEKNCTYGKITRLLPFSGETTGREYVFGDTVKISLSAYETQILHFGRKAKPIKAEYVKAVSANSVEVTFNQFINKGAISCSANAVKSVELLQDYMSAVITFEDAFSGVTKLNLNNVKDLLGNSADVDISFDYYENNIVTNGVYGMGEFSIKATLEGENEQTLYSQGDEITLKIGSDGHISFMVGFTCLKSNKSVKDVVQIVAVREKTGVLKLYLNGELDSGTKCIMSSLSGEKGVSYNPNKVVLYNKALAFDEV